MSDQNSPDPVSHPKKPPIVPLIPWLVSQIKRKRDERRAAQSEKETSEQRSARITADATRVIAVFAVVAGLVGISQAVIANRQLTAMQSQLTEMHEQTVTTRNQIRANIGDNPWRVDQVRENGQIVAWDFTPEWKNSGGTDAMEVRDWWGHTIIRRHYDSFNEVTCPPVGVPPPTHPFVVQTQHPFAQGAQRIDAADISKAGTHDVQIIFAGRVDYRDIFPDDPPHYVDWCSLVIPTNATNNDFSFFSLRQDAR